MRLAELPEAALAARLAQTQGIVLDSGLACARVRDHTGKLAAVMRVLYADYPAAADEALCDITVTLEHGRLLRRWYRPQVELVVDGTLPFEPFPADTAFPLVEWGVNWCVAERMQSHLLLHAGAVARDGVGVLLPAASGSGKSTLTAALMLRGYRMLSDEFGAIRLADCTMIPSVRPIALKNESVAIIRAFAPSAVLGPVFRKTRKGDVAHAAPTADSVAMRHSSVAPGLVVFPQYRRDCALSIHAVQAARAFVQLAGNSFNYELLGPLGFQAVAQLLRKVPCYRIEYGTLDDAIAGVDRLVDQIRSGQ